MKPQILFEDAEILVCHKPAGTAVQTASFSAQDMVSILKNHLALEMRKKETVTAYGKGRNRIRAGGTKATGVEAAAAARGGVHR